MLKPFLFNPWTSDRSDTITCWFPFTKLFLKRSHILNVLCFIWSFDTHKKICLWFTVSLVLNLMSLAFLWDSSKKRVFCVMFCLINMNKAPIWLASCSPNDARPVIFRIFLWTFILHKVYKQNLKSWHSG